MNPNPGSNPVRPSGFCKSNVIDAVRWVLGESSAKHLRGDPERDVVGWGDEARCARDRSFAEHIDVQVDRMTASWSTGLPDGFVSRLNDGSDLTAAKS